MDPMSRTRSLALAALAFAGCARAGDPFTFASIDEVERMLGQPGVTIVDANVPETFREHHVPGARHWRSAPFASLLPADRNAPVLFYCASPG